MFEEYGFESDPTDNDTSVGSPEYSDQWSSDLEDTLYGKIHHTDQLSLETVVDDNACVSLANAKRKNETPSIVLPTMSENSNLSVKTTPCFLKQTSKDSLQCVFTNKSSAGLLTNKKSMKLPDPLSSSISPKSDTRLTHRKSKKKEFKFKTSTPLPGSNTQTCDRVSESSGGDESSDDDEVVFVEAKNYEKKNLKRKSDGRDRNSKIMTTSHLKIAKHSKKLQHTISVSSSSSDSSDDVICVDSISSSDDMMTNVSLNNSFLSSDYSSSNSDDSTESASRLSSFTDSIGGKKSSWHIDDADRVNICSDRKSRKLHFASACRRCKESGHKEYNCSKVRSIKCYLCGGAHKSSMCEKKVCGLCYSLGHDRNRCLYRMESIICGHCQVPGHIASRCPDIWRRYHLTTSTEAIERGNLEMNLQQGQAYCYNCGLEGHFGYQCQKPRLCRASRPCLPFIVSYKNPQKLMRKSSTPGCKSIKRKCLQKNMTLSRFATKTKDFQRTPKSSSSQNSVSLPLLNSDKKRKKNSKKKKKTDKSYFLQQTS